MSNIDLTEEQRERLHKANQDPKNSLLYWYPIAKKAGVPMPKTVIFEPKKPTLEEWFKETEGNNFQYLEPKWSKKLIKKLESEIDFPIFMKTDQTASKFGGKKTCIVLRPDLLIRNLDENLFLLFSQQPGHTSPSSIIARELLIPASVKSADGTLIQPIRPESFGGLTIGREARLFVRNGNLECQHPYWQEEAISKESEATKGQLAVLNDIAKEDIAELKKHGEKLAKRLEGYWSLDFMLAQDKGWLFIDAALGDCSAHIADCPHNPYRSAQ